ncbi:MAG: cell division protein FtsZ [Bacteroidota bacterium]|nr:cell division protein FtsZ [Bacteroidota bacterium]
MTYKFEVPNNSRSIIKVIGVGGGGGNAVNYMYQQGIHDVEFFICNTDLQALRTSPIPNKIQIGGQLTEGLGAGTNPEMGRQAALEDKERIREVLADTKMLFVTAGMGGGTGTGAAPVIAKISKEMDILTVGIVTMPFTFEGRKKILLAEEGIKELKAHCDTVIVIMNDKIREIHGNLNFKEAFSQADNILTTAAKSIAEIITNPGHMNIDFQDVNMVMKQAGAAVMGSSVQSGKDRAIRAAESALHSPLLNNTDITGAKKILVSITACDPEQLTMDEYAEINDYYQETAGQDALLKCGVSIDPEIGESIRVTVIATGFEPSTYKIPESKTVIDLNSNRQTSIFEQLPERNTPIDALPPIIEAQKGVFAKASNNEKVVIDINTGEKPTQGTIFQPSKSTQPETNDYQEIDADKKKKIDEDYVVRTSKLSELTTYSSMSQEEFKERLEVPAYERRKIQLTEVPHSSEREVSRFSLNEDNELLGNNKFLHDNVD